MAELDKFADCAIICTQDQLHKVGTILFLVENATLLLSDVKLALHPAVRVFARIGSADLLAIACP